MLGEAAGDSVAGVAKQAGIWRFAMRFFRGTPSHTVAEAEARTQTRWVTMPTARRVAKSDLVLSPEAEARTQRILKEGEELVGAFRSRGLSAPDPKAGWQIKETTRWGDFDDFARWIRGNGPAPGRDGTMNCCAAILYTAHLAGEVDEAALRRLYTEAADAGRIAHQEKGMWAGYDAYDEKISDFLGPGERTSFTIDPVTRVGGPDIPAGHVVFVNDTEHVMLSLGTRDAEGRQEVLSHWVYPESHFFGTPEEYGFMQKTTVEEVISSSKMHDLPIESAAPSWLFES